MVIETVIDHNAEEVAFLWLLRDAAVRSPHYNVDDLVELDSRVEAHLDGLRIASDDGWNTCAKALAPGESGEVFAAAVLALESRNRGRLDEVLTAVETAAHFRGLVSAFGWISQDSLRGTVKDLLPSPVALLRRAGIAACAVHRVDPGHALRQALDDEDAPLRARALRAVGELGRLDLADELYAALQSDDVACRFWAAWSLVMTGHRRAAQWLTESFGALQLLLRPRVMQVVLRVLSPADARQWLKELHQNDEFLRDVIVGSGTSGDPSYVPWVIGHMATPNVARVAGEAFSMITGVDLAYEHLDGEPPDDFGVGPTENPEDETVTMDLDRDLPWPEPELVGKWWDANQSRFTSGQRYLVGKPVTAKHCRHVLRTGYQRHRVAAALELALAEPGSPLFETRAPGFRQQRQLKGALTKVGVPHDAWRPRRG